MTDPQSLNRYSYTQNDPINFIDPTGLDDETIYPFICVNRHLFGDTNSGRGGRIGGGGIGGGGNGLFGLMSKDDLANFIRDNLCE